MLQSSLKTKYVSVPREAPFGRDQGKTLVIVEMPAVQAEKWAMRAFMALKGSESQIPTEIKSLGMVGVAIVGLNVLMRASVKFEDLEPLLDEMLTCVRAAPDPQNPEQTRPLIAGEILEVPTLAWLRSQVLELHTGFSLADALSEFLTMISTPATSSST